MKQEQLWSMSTTIREAERIIGFLKTAVQIDGEEWDDDSQAKFQVLLVQNRQYLNNPENNQIYNKLNEEQCKLLKDKSINMTYEQAQGIIESKNYVGGSAMRGRQSMSPLYKLGLVYIIDNKVTVTDVGHKLINGEIDFGDFMLDSLLKFQYPNPYEKSYRCWNTKPFINTLRLIKKVNELCNEQGLTARGISKIEFGIFALSLKSFESVDDVAEKIIEFRKEYKSIKDKAEKDRFVCDYTNTYLSDFKNPVQNTQEYTDNMIRYFRLTKYIYIRGKYANTYVDLEPRRMTEINSILDSDDGSARLFSEEEWCNYMGVYGTYVLPFETIEKLHDIRQSVIDEIHSLEAELNFEFTVVEECKTVSEYKTSIDHLRECRTKLQNLKIKVDFHNNTQKIDEAINALKDIKDHNKAKLAKKYSIELEKWSNVALNIINDSRLIKPNAPVGDDNEPTYTAPSGVADIECYYSDFNAICEVTMLKGRDQWYNEGQPVMRHLRSFEGRSDKQCYCLFIAPSLHTDTINTFYTSVRYEYEGEKQKIIPITITQLIAILELIKEMIAQNRVLKHTHLKDLYEECIDMNKISNATAWLPHIDSTLNNWKNKLIS